MRVNNLGDAVLFTRTPVSNLEKEVMGYMGGEKVEDLDDSTTYMMPIKKQSGLTSQDDDKEVMSPNILVIDDDAMNVTVLQAMLSEKGLASDSAMSGPLALKLIKQRVQMLLDD